MLLAVKLDIMCDHIAVVVVWYLADMWIGMEIGVLMSTLQHAAQQR